MARVKAKSRKRMKKSSFGLPGKRKYLIHDKAHARLALAMVSKHGSPAEKKQVRARVRKKFPSIKQKGKRK